MLVKPIGWVIFGIGLTWAMVAMARERINRRKMVENRPRLSDDEIYRQFYEQSGLQRRAVLLMWHEVAHALHVDPGKLRPSDRFSRPQPNIFHLRSDIDDLDDWLSMLSSKSKLNPAKLDTIDDLVRFAVQCEAVV